MSAVIVVFILVVAIIANVVANLVFPAALEVAPVIGLAVWGAIFATAVVRRPDWGIMPVGFGGLMIWFGSSAGVAISNMYPEAKSVGLWLRHG
jgi:hypothetical protein